MDKSEHGFTLVELVTVIIILGILSAVAAPRFVNMQGSARISALNGLRAAVSSAATLTSALQMASNLASNAAVTVDGTAVTMANRYPIADATGIGRAIIADSGTFTSTGSNPIIFRITAASNPTTCQFTYTAAASGASPAISTPVVTGC